tara:strand:+ start:640 stop:1263 length:624 start_codon:yes stop_codon:yes gene_type:complete
MPLKKVIQNNDFTLAMWQITEDSIDLVRKLKPVSFELKYLNRIKHEKRKTQNISARILLNLFANKKVYLKYLENGVPYCDEFQFISISHSHNITIVTTSKDPIGVDVQYKNKLVNKVQSKFINSNDVLLRNTNLNTNLNLIWCYKESVYKALNGRKCSLKTNIEINLKDKIGVFCTKNEVEKFKLERILIKDYFITIAKKINNGNSI